VFSTKFLRSSLAGAAGFGSSAAARTAAASPANAASGKVKRGGILVDSPKGRPLSTADLTGIVTQRRGDPMAFRGELLAVACLCMTVGTVRPADSPAFTPGAAPPTPGKPGAILERHEFESKHMGTTFRVVLYAPDAATAKKAADAAFARVAELDAVMS